MDIVILLIKLFILFNLIMGLASICTWIERKGSALIQDRIGANRAGAFFQFKNPSVRQILLALRIAGALGLLVIGALYAARHIFSLQILPSVQDSDLLLFAALAALVLVTGLVESIVRALGILGVINTLVCDGVKAILKEDFIPEGVPNFIHCLAPFMAVFPIFVAYALIPFAPDFNLGGHLIRAQVASLDAGVLFIFAMGSISVYGVAFAGWTGNNKFSLLGGLRAAAQMISYELAMGITLVTVILVYGTLDLYEMVEAQKYGLGIIQGVTMPICFLVLFVVGMAETKRGPFDLPEAESELAAGYFTEYSGMKFLLFWLGEFAEIALFAALLVILFFGGWKIPFVDLPAGTWQSALIGHMVLMGKILFFWVLQIVLRWTLPRFRYDQLMNLGWKILLPISMANLMLTAFLIVI